MEPAGHGSLFRKHGILGGGVVWLLGGCGWRLDKARCGRSRSRRGARKKEARWGAIVSRIE